MMLSVVSDDENDNCNDILIPEFENAIAEFSKDLIARVKADPSYYQKSVSAFTLCLKNIKSANSESFKSALFSFQKKVNFSTKKGRKKKTCRRIKIQSTSVSRRLYKARGNKISQKGWPPKLVRLKYEVVK